MFYAANFFNDLFMPSVISKCLKSISGTGIFYKEPAVNICEEGDTVTVKALMPGVNAEDLNIELVDKELIIEGERKSDAANDNYLLKERNFGRFKRSVFLPFDVDVEKVSAVLADGVFTVTLEKSENAKVRKIEIH